MVSVSNLDIHLSPGNDGGARFLFGILLFLKNNMDLAENEKPIYDDATVYGYEWRSFNKTCMHAILIIAPTASPNT
jgi:hypothetical protein